MKPVLTKDIGDDFFEELDAVAQRLSTYEVPCKPLDLLAVWNSESGVQATAHNDGPPGAPDEKRYHASGIFQAMPATLKGLGWVHGHAEFRRLTAKEQLFWATRYYLPHVGFLGSIGQIYTATFLPALLRQAKDRDFILTASGKGPAKARLGWAYAPNAVFDANRDYAITVGELEDAVRRNCVTARWRELVARFEHSDAPESEINVGFDLRTVAGIQRTLDVLGYEPGPADGIPGPRTRAALVAFQREHPPLVVDGIVGPITRNALTIAFDEARERIAVT